MQAALSTIRIIYPLQSVHVWRCSGKQEGKILDAEEVSIEYMRPGLFDDEVCVHSTISDAGEGKCIIRQTIERGDDTLAKLSVHAVLKTFPGLSAEYIPEELTRA